MSSSTASTLEVVAPQVVALETIRLRARLRDFIAGYEAEPGLYVQGAWHVVEPARSFVPNWHIDAICDRLEACTRGELKRLIITVPPGHMKSLTTAVFWVAWEWTLKPETRWLCASYSQDFATRDSGRCRTLVESEWYRQRWGSVVQLSEDSNLKTRFENLAGGYRAAASIGSDPTGWRADKVVLDDPHKIKEAHSALKRRQVHEFHDLTISSRFADPRTGCKVIIMQRVHEDDLVGHVLEQDDWTTLCLPAEYEPNHPFVWPDDPREEAGDLLWPELYGDGELERLKREFGSYGTATLLQQRAAPQEGGIIKLAWWRYYDPALVEGTWTLPVPERLVTYWDTALKAKTTNDFTAGSVWAVAGANRYLLRVLRGRWTLPEIKREVHQLADWTALKFPGIPHNVYVENTANGPEVVAELRDEVPGLLLANVEQDKVSRAHAQTPALEAGNVYVPGYASADGSGPDTARTSISVLDFLEECRVFDNGANDDQVDSFTGAMSKARTGATMPPRDSSDGRKSEKAMLSAGLYDRQF